MRSAPFSGIWTAAAATRSLRHAIRMSGHGTLRLLGFFHDEKSGSTFKEEATGQYRAGGSTRRSSRRADPCGVQRIRVREETEKIKRMSVCENRRSNKEEHYGK